MAKEVKRYVKITDGIFACLPSLWAIPIISVIGILYYIYRMICNQLQSCILCIKECPALTFYDGICFMAIIVLFLICIIGYLWTRKVYWREA
jgi:hypothetical protein